MRTSEVPTDQAGQEKPPALRTPRDPCTFFDRVSSGKNMDTVQQMPILQKDDGKSMAQRGPRLPGWLIITAVARWGGEPLA